MAFETIVVAFATGPQATSAIRAVRTLGVPASDIRRHPADLGDAETARAAVEQESGIWKWLFGRQVSASESDVYEEAVKSGGIVVSISVIEEEVERIKNLLSDFGPLSLQQH